VGVVGEVWRMRAELDDEVVGAPIWPEGIRVRTFRAGDGRSVHSLLEHGYRHGGGSVDAFETWLPRMTSDDEFDPELWFLAEAGGELAAAALCWTSAFVKDLVVHERWRRRGLGEALLRHVFAVFRARGATAVELKVQSDNSAAIRLYERVGMRVSERLSSA
jgi:ribosomal protein S18 acetylase RimI-like enzyme